MRSRPFRAFAFVATIALIVGACGSSASNPPAASGGAPVSGSAPAPTITIAGGTAAPGQVDIRWYCCLGGGDAPEQVAVEKKVVEAFNASATPNIHVTFEAVPYAGANDALATEIGSGNGPDIVGPVGIGGANAFHGQWLDLAPLIQKTNYDLSGFPEDAVDIYKLDEGQVGIPFAIYPSVLFYTKSLFDEAGLDEPPHKYGDKYTMPDGTMVDWNYDTISKIAKLLTVDKNGKDATQDGLRPGQHRPVGLRAAARRPARPRRLLRAPASLAARRRQDRPDPRRLEGGLEVLLRRHVEGPLQHDRAASSRAPDINPDGYPFFTGKVAMSENFLWSTYGARPASSDDWDLAAIPSYNGSKVTAAFNADTFRILKATKHPDEAFEVLTYLLGEASPDLLTTYGGMPARTADQAKRSSRPLQAQFTRRSTGRSRSTASRIADNPNFEALHAGLQRDPRPRRLGRQVHDQVADRRRGSTWTPSSTRSQTEIQAIWDKAGSG